MAQFSLTITVDAVQCEKDCNVVHDYGREFIRAGEWLVATPYGLTKMTSGEIGQLPRQPPTAGWNEQERRLRQALETGYL